MKSTMKSTFAIIAVALMVMVAVVPMVSVFTDAAVKTYYDPADKDRDEKKITIVANVYTDIGGGVNNTKVMIKWGPNSQFSAVGSTGSYAAAKIVLDDTTATKAVAYVVTGTGTEDDPYVIDEEYGSVSINGGNTLLSGETYYANLVDGFKSVTTPEIVFKDPTDDSVSIYDISYAFPGAEEIIVSYKLTDADGKAVPTVGSAKGEGTAVLVDNAITVSYQASATVVKIAITGINVDGSAVSAITAPAQVVVGAEAVENVILKQSMITFTTGSIIPVGNVDSFKVASSETGTNEVSATVISAPIANEKNAIVVYEWTAKDAQQEIIQPSHVKFNVKYGTSITDTGAYTAIADFETNGYVPSGFTGTYKLNGDSDIQDGGSLSIKVGTSTVSSYVADGCYYAVRPSFSTAVEATITSTLGTTTPATKQIEAADTQIGNISVDIGNYVNVSGKVYGVPSGFTFTVNGFTKNMLIGGTIASSGTSATITVGNAEVGADGVYAAEYSFWVQKMDEINFTAPSGVTFTNVSTQKFIVNSTMANKDINVVSKSMTFVFTDSDGNKLNMGTTAEPKVTIKYLIPGEETFKTAVIEVSTTATNKVTAPIADYTADLSKVLVYFANANAATNTFAADSKDTAVAYGSGASLSVVTNDKTYKIVLENYEADPITIAPTSINAYAGIGKIAQDKTKIYTFDDDEATYVADLTTVATKGYATVKIDKAYANAVATEAGTAMLFIVVNYADYLFEPYYLFTTDDGSDTITLKAHFDSRTGILTKTDGVTPIAGATVSLFVNNSATAEYVTTTSQTGEFTVYSDTTITNGNTAKDKLTFVRNGYTFADSYPLIKDGATAIYESSKDTVFVYVQDSDGATFFDGNVTFTASGADPISFTGSSITGLYSNLVKLTEGTIYTVAFTAGDRTADAYTVTAEDISLGLISLTTKQSTYAITLDDADGNDITAIAIPTAFTLFRYADGQYDDGTDVTAKVTAYDADTGIRTIVLDDLAAPYTAYYITATLASAGDKYAFDGTKKVLMDPDGTVLTSSSKVVIVPVMDYDGNVLTVSVGAAANVPKIAVGTSVTPAELTYVNTTIYQGMIKFIQDSEQTKYTISWNSCKIEGASNDNFFDIDGYTTYVVEDGVVVSTNRYYEVTAYDALMEELDADDVVLTGYVESTDTFVSITPIGGGAIELGVEFVAAGGEYAYYLMESDVDLFEYTFESSITTVFVANEQTVEPVFAGINGSVVGPTTYGLVAYGEDGSIIGTNLLGELIVDVDEVAYYELIVTTSEDPYFPALLDIDSTTNVFVTPITKVTGSLPVAAVADDYVLIEQYLGEQVVFTDTVNLAAGAKTYTIYVDVSGMVDEVAGVPFDSIYATYVHDGAVYASVAVDPTAVFNPIIPSGGVVLPYEVELVSPSAIIALHVDYGQVGNTVTVTADSKFMVADDEGIYTDGQYVYTFAGWYVDNKQVSASPVFTFELTDDVVISPQYTVTYEKISDANDKQTPQPEPVQPDNSIDTNVLIIGICAVIVALIAVVYAVIKKE